MSGAVVDPVVSTPSRPELILFVLIDALRPDHLGAYGDDRGLTPTLDRLAEQGHVFERAHATSSWTGSSVASMFTSLHPSAAGVLTRFDALEPEHLTLAEILSQQGGYATWGLSTNHMAGRRVGFAQGFDRFERPEEDRSYPDDFPIVTAGAVTDMALAWTAEWRAQGEDRPPLFLFLHYTDPHDPLFPHEGLLETPEPPGRFDGSRRDLDRMFFVPEDELTADDLGRIRHLYAGEVLYCDLSLDHLLNALIEQGVEPEDTLVLVTSDHGEGLWDRGWRSHAKDLYQEMLHVPLIVKPPQGARGTVPRVDTPVSLVDLAPTILGYAGLDAPDAFEGLDLAPLVHGQARPPGSEVVYAEMWFAGRNLEAVILDGHKLIRNRDEDPELAGSYQLYDLRADPGEREDLIGGNHPMKLPLLGAMRSLGRSIRREAPAPTMENLEQLPWDVIEQMRALGYVGSDEYEQLKDARDG